MGKFQSNLPVGQQSAGGQGKTSKRTQMAKVEESHSNRTLPNIISEYSIGRVLYP